MSSFTASGNGVAVVVLESLRNGYVRKNGVDLTIKYENNTYYATTDIIAGDVISWYTDDSWEQYHGFFIEFTF